MGFFIGEYTEGAGVGVVEFRELSDFELLLILNLFI